MSQIETLYTGSVAASESRITIGKDRMVSVPNALKRIAVQNDHNIETITFDCPRYWDGYDMSEMTVYINYRRANGDTGMYKADNVAPDKYYVDIMHFDWSITKNVSMVPGKITFQVCVKKVDEEGNEKHHWNSEVCKDCYVSESLKCDGEEIVEQYPDILEQWYQELTERCDAGDFDGPPGVSPIIEVSDITGGHRITITDINGVQHFDVMDTYIDSSEAVTALLSDYASISSVEPEAGPAIWFDLRDKVTNSGIIKIKAADGTVQAFYPNTFKANVSGLNDIETIVNVINAFFTNGILSIAHGGTGASDYTTALENLNAASADHEHEKLNDLDSYFENGVAKIQNGGTGASDATTARKNLGAAAEGHTHDVEAYFNNGVASIAHGGTGASDAATARQNLGAAAEDHIHDTLDPSCYGTELPAEAPLGKIFYKKKVISG